MKIKDLIKELQMYNPEYDVVKWTHENVYTPITGIGVGKITRKENEYTCRFYDESECYRSEWNAIEFHL